jgi:8-oxo-dGTP diphosphatase
VAGRAKECAITRYSGVFLLTPTLDVILQLRDSNTTIENPGAISSFGGSANESEDELACALRELWEETALVAPPTALELLGTVHKSRAQGSVDCTFYFIRNVRSDELRISEGQMIVMSFDSALGDDRLTPTCRRMLESLQYACGVNDVLRGGGRGSS